MKKTGIFLIALIIAISGCKKDKFTNQNSDITTQINAFPKEALSEEEILSLKWMREEEKLAHDVYVSMYSKWNVNIFSNIAASEQSHTNAVLALLDKYELIDPVGTNPVGIFSDSTLQELYTQLVTQGNLTLRDGYEVGATIEDLDIYDLNNWIAKVDNQDIKFVYQNLNRGSRNHMRSFYSQLIGSGVTYTAKYISQVELDAIVNSPKETGSW